MDSTTHVLIQPHCVCFPRHHGAIPGQCDGCGAPTWSDLADEAVKKLTPNVKVVCNHCFVKMPTPPKNATVLRTIDVAAALAQSN